MHKHTHALATNTRWNWTAFIPISTATSYVHKTILKEIFLSVHFYFYLYFLFSFAFLLSSFGAIKIVLFIVFDVCVRVSLSLALTLHIYSWHHFQSSFCLAQHVCVLKYGRTVTQTSMKKTWKEDEKRIIETVNWNPKFTHTEREGERGDRQSSSSSF